MNFEQKLKTINAKLDRVSLRQHKQSLFMRATLPPKPGSGHTRYISWQCRSFGGVRLMVKYIGNALPLPDWEAAPERNYPGYEP